MNKENIPITSSLEPRSSLEPVKRSETFDIEGEPDRCKICTKQQENSICDHCEKVLALDKEKTLFEDVDCEECRKYTDFNDETKKALLSEEDCKSFASYEEMIEDLHQDYEESTGDNLEVFPMRRPNPPEPNERLKSLFGNIIKLTEEESRELEHEMNILRHPIPKCPLHLVPPEAIEAIAMCFADGATKYGERSWENDGFDTEERIAAVMRHLSALRQGEEYAPDSGLHHAAHAMTDACMLYIQAVRGIPNIKR